LKLVFNGYVLVRGYTAKLEELIVINHANTHGKQPFCNMYKAVFSY